MINKIYRQIIILLTVVTLSPYCYAAEEVDSIVAIVEEDVVLRSELDTRVRTITNQLMEQGTPLPPESVMEKQVLDRLILSKLQIQMAENTGIRVDDETLNRTIISIASENELTLDQFREILEADGYTYEKFREDIRNEILLSRLRQRQVDNRVFISDREIDDFLINLQHQGGMEKEYLISHVLISLPESPTQEDLEQSRRLANKVQTELREGADISTMAVTYSDGDQALNGGDLGWLKYSQVPTLFVEFIATMEKSDISELIRSPSGYHIIKIMDVRDAEKLVITQTLARHIFIKPSEINSEDDVKNRLLSLKRRIENGDDFSELARGNSEDVVTAADGGDLGWVSPGDLTPEFESIMDQVAINQVSDPIQEQQGWHIVQVLDRREHDGTDDIRRARAREIIRQRKMDEESELWLTQLRDDAYVEYRLE
jgi:peptidyl-prolyl cis-trans isomerase SurA